MERLLVDGRTRSFLLHLPPEPKGAPLIIALHALGSNPYLMEAMTELSLLSDREDIIVAYPIGIRASDQGERAWNAWFCCRDALYEKVNDVGFLSAIIDELDYRYDLDGTLITGMSNGGMLAHLAGIQLSNKVTAIAPVAATIGDVILELKPQRPLPVLMINGGADEMVPFYHSHRYNLLPAEEAVDYWVRVNECLDSPTIRERNGVLVERYRSRDGKADVLSYRSKDAGHVWPGSRVRMHNEEDPMTMNATAIIWNFFRDQLR